MAEASAGFARPGAGALLGRGVFIMTLDQGPDMERYQGVTAIEGETLALAAESYFTRSEQTPTRVRLAVARVDQGDGPRWRAGGLVIQNIAGDEARGPTAEAWTTAQALIETVGEDELVDPTLSPRDLLWRLFHQEGVRLFDATALTASCRCSETRIVEVLNAFPAEERVAMIEPDGHIRVTCEYCARVYDVAPERVG